MKRQLLPEARHFRELVIDALWDDDRFGYVDEDTFVGTCPVCGFAIGVKFVGLAARASLLCNAGCSESEVADRIGLRVLR